MGKVGSVDVHTKFNIEKRLCSFEDFTPIKKHLQTYHHKGDTI